MISEQNPEGLTKGVIRKYEQKIRLGQTVSKTESDNHIIQNTQARIKALEDRQGKTEL